LKANEFLAAGSGRAKIWLVPHFWDVEAEAITFLGKEAESRSKHGSVWHYITF